MIAWITACRAVWDLALVVLHSIRPLPVTCPSSCEYTELIIVSFPTA